MGEAVAHVEGVGGMFDTGGCQYLNRRRFPYTQACATCDASREVSVSQTCTVVAAMDARSRALQAISREGQTLVSCWANSGILPPSGLEKAMKSTICQSDESSWGGSFDLGLPVDATAIPPSFKESNPRTAWKNVRL